MSWGQYDVRIFRKSGGIGGRRHGEKTLDPKDVRQLLAALDELLPSGAKAKDYRIEVWSIGRRSRRVAGVDG